MSNRPETQALSDELAPAGGRVGRALLDAGFTIRGVTEALGEQATSALFRGEPEAVEWALERRRPALGPLIRAFLLRRPVASDEVAALLGADTAAMLRAAGVLCGDGPGRVRATVDVRPVRLGERDRIVFSDCDASVSVESAAADHVPGVGHASLTLEGSVPHSPVDSVLDLGSGCGIQSLAQVDCARRITATDVLPRALAFTRATLGAAGATDAEVLQGAWFEPVAGRRFERIVANPPFVVGPPEVGHVYRDSGLGLDGASATVVAGVHEHLTAGGRAHLLAAWAHVSGQDWAGRVAGWLPDHGAAAWVLERDRVDPATYVGTWLRDEGVDPRSAEGGRRTRAWLDHFAEHDVEAIGFGFVAVERIADDAPSEIVAEKLTQQFTDPLGAEVEEYFARTAWLRGRDSAAVAASRFRVRPGLAREDVALPDDAAGMGFHRAVLRLTRTDGPRFSHEVDRHVAAIVAGLNPDGLALGEVAELYAAAQGLDAKETTRAACTVVVDLVRHGLVLPAELG